MTDNRYTQDQIINEWSRLNDAYDSSERCAEPSCEDAAFIHRIEISFAITVAVSQDQMRQLHKLIDDIVDSPCNQPKEGVHWPSGSGCKVLWREPAEPDFDDSVYAIETTSRAFASLKERDRVYKRRAKQMDDMDQSDRGGSDNEMS